uniref:Branched-chain amino acid aminotransferase n=1 Tax=Schlesneria paludicola TaxID=360056 RepID=A0A7C4QNI2_9PLAN
MRCLWYRLWKDDAGFVLSSELVLIATIVILSAVVGLSEISLAINQELKDVATAFAAVNQGFGANGTTTPNGEEVSLLGVPPQSEAN